MSSDGEHDATVKTLTAEVRVLMVGSRQVTLSVYGQLDQVDYAEIEPFGRVNPRGEDDYLCIVGRSKRDGTLVRSRVPYSSDALAAATGFDVDEYERLSRRAQQLDEAAKRYAASPGAFYSSPSWERAKSGSELLADAQAGAKGDRQKMADMLGRHERDREPLDEIVEEVELLPLIVLAGLR